MKNYLNFKKQNKSRKNVKVKKHPVELRKYIMLAGKIFNVAEINGKIHVYL